MNRCALRAMQIGAIAVVLAVTTFEAFELDRFFVPKELVLHAVAVVAGLCVLRRVRFTRVDWLLVAYLFLSAVASLFATNPWLAMRAVTISASAIVLFWAARVIREEGHATALLNALACAVVLVAVTSLLQTYGIETALFAENRAPGGTLGNRNFVAHAGAFGLPLLLLFTLRRPPHPPSAPSPPRGGGEGLLGGVGVAIVVASLVLTRSRAAWLAFGAVVVVFAIAMLIGRARGWGRAGAIVLFAAAGVAAAVLIPNALRWRSDNPYLESLERVADYQGGSGRGRLVQYERSLRMAARHPLLGVGPGNWAVAYPAHAARNDPSMSDSEPGTTFNPWPSSDWVAIVAERGFAAFAVMALVFLTIAINGVRQLFAARDSGDSEEVLRAAALLGTIAGAAVTGLFDAVLLLALPAFLVWPALGALWIPQSASMKSRTIVVLAVVVIAAAGAVRSAAQLAAMQLFAARRDRASLVRAARIDPGNYRLRLRLARIGGRKQRCEHARAALGLFPNAEAARAVSRGCGE